MKVAKSEYVCRYLSSGSPGNAQILLSQSGQSKPGLTLKNLKDFLLAVPSISEQIAIITALGDMDSLLKSLDRLIAKKRDIKQAAMQQLLTGKTRLPGFEGEWRCIQLGSIGRTYGGLTGKTKVDFGTGSDFYVPFVNIMGNLVIACRALERVQVLKGESQNLVQYGDLLFNGSSETPEEVAMCAVMDVDYPNLYLNSFSFSFGFRLKKNVSVSPLFLAYYIRSCEGRELMKLLAQGSTRYNISKLSFLKLFIKIPFFLEQTAIAEVLSDMDAEISALEKRRAKTADIKQAMMQELLTGKTRLI